MLVLSRKTDERIQIGPRITVVVVRIGRDQVRLGIDAPDEVKIHREEIARLIEARAAEAALQA